MNKNVNLIKYVEKLLNYSIEILDCYDKYKSIYISNDNYKYDNIVVVVETLKKILFKENKIYDYLENNINSKADIEKIILILNQYFYNLLNDPIILARIENHLDYLYSKKFDHKKYAEIIFKNDFEVVFQNCLIDADCIDSILDYRLANLYKNKIVERKFLSEYLYDNQKQIMEYKYVFKKLAIPNNFYEELQINFMNDCLKEYKLYSEANNYEYKAYQSLLLKSKLIFIDDIKVDYLLEDLDYNKEFNYLVKQSREDREKLYYLEYIKKRK